MMFSFTHDIWAEDPMPVPGTGPEAAVVIRRKMPPRQPMRRVASSLEGRGGTPIGVPLVLRPKLSTRRRGRR